MRYAPSIVLGLLLWQVLAWLVASPVLPAPAEVFQKLGRLAVSGRLFADLGWTLLRVGLGTGAGCVLGLALGVLLSHSRIAFVLLDPLVQLARPVSPFAWTPLVILVFGLGNAPAIVTILAGVLLPAVVIVFDAIRHIDQEMRDIARIFGASGWTLIRRVELPLVAPQLLSALRVLFGVGWVLAIGAEMLAAGSGLGFRLMNARYLIDFPQLYAMIIVIGLAGFGLDRLLQAFARISEL
jgi:ABC-type nitrate/sulfonate/bicarbonate transport system permease component